MMRWLAISDPRHVVAPIARSATNPTYAFPQRQHGVECCFSLLLSSVEHAVAPHVYACQVYTGADARAMQRLGVEQGLVAVVDALLDARVKG